MLDKESYIKLHAEHEPTLAKSGPEWLHTLRKTAIGQFAEQGFPTLKNEEWRFTRVRPLLQHGFNLAPGYKPNGVAQSDLDSVSFTDAGLHRMVLVNGHHAPNLSKPEPLPDGVVVMNLRTALEEVPELVEPHLAKLADTKANPFVALNTAHVLDGAFVYVRKNVVVDRPIHFIFMTTAKNAPLVSHPRNLVVAEEGSRATILESWVGHEDLYFTNTVTEIVVADNARIDHYKVQKESAEAYHIATIQAKLGRDSRLNTNSISLGGTFVRNDVNTYLNGEGIHCMIDGLYMADAHQHVDNHTSIDHAMPNCESHELYKGILNGRAKAVFNGRIHVHQDAQKTDAKQSNRCLLLSDEAQINTNPQLEIYADDVKCTHGAAVGQIDERSIFYLRSRCIPEEQARHMLIYAFANELLERIEVAALRDRLADDLYQWLARAQVT